MRAVALLPLPLLAAADFPVPTAFPDFSWDRVPVFIHGCEGSGALNDSQLALLAKFPIVTIEKGQGQDTPGPAEPKMAAAAAQYRAVRPGGWVIAYLNAILDWEMFGLHEQFAARPELWLRNASGDPVRMPGDNHFPQPKEGMLTFDHSQRATRDLFVSECVNFTRPAGGGFDGCFIDRADYALAVQGKLRSTYGMTNESVQALIEGQELLMAELQDAVGSDHMVIAKDKGKTAGFKDIRFSNTLFLTDSFCSGKMAECSEELHAARDAAKRGQMVQAHGQGGYNDEANFNFTLAAFLCFAEEHSHYSYSEGWYFSGVHWWEQWDRPLGAPLGDAVVNGTGAKESWRRSFAGGAVAWVDLAEHKGRVDWP